MVSNTQDQEALLELVQRLLIQPYSDAMSVDLHPGRLPPDRSVTLPLPHGGQLLGSAVYRRGGAILRAETVVDVPTAPAAALRSYEEQLCQEGWGVFGLFPHSGFTPASSGVPRSFRHRRGGPALIVHLIDGGKQATCFRLQLDWQAPQQHMPRHPHEGMDLIPSLLAPLDVEMDGGGVEAAIRTGRRRQPRTPKCRCGS